MLQVLEHVRHLALTVSSSAALPANLLQAAMSGPIQPRRGAQAWRILLVETDEGDRESMAKNLLRQGHQVRGVSTGENALTAYEDADVVLLGLELADRDGLEVCRAIRTASNVPIIAVTAHSSEVDTVLGFQAGADDFVVKPLGVWELTARIDAVMRRARPRSQTPRVIEHGPLRIDHGSREVTYDGRRIRLTRKEFDLLRFLASHPRTVIARNVVMEEVWGGPCSQRTMDTHVNSLRTKLGSSDWIVTVRGVGFMIGEA
ncbi:response regulator transcription factor [Streptomyces sp. NPDC054794]